MYVLEIKLVIQGIRVNKIEFLVGMTLAIQLKGLLFF